MTDAEWMERLDQANAKVTLLGEGLRKAEKSLTAAARSLHAKFLLPDFADHLLTNGIEAQKVLRLTGEEYSK